MPLFIPQFKTPTYINANTTFTIDEYTQVVNGSEIDNEGIIQIDGTLVEVPLPSKVIVETWLTSGTSTASGNYALLIGCGGGGSGVVSSTINGGAGSNLTITIIPVTIGSNYIVTIGAGGAPAGPYIGSDIIGNNGSDSTYGSLVTMVGAGGGVNYGAYSYSVPNRTVSPQSTGGNTGNQLIYGAGGMNNSYGSIGGSPSMNGFMGGGGGGGSGAGGGGGPFGPGGNGATTTLLPGANGSSALANSGAGGGSAYPTTGSYSGAGGSGRLYVCYFG